MQYLLVSNPDISDADALNVRYPTLWNDGAGMSQSGLRGIRGQRRGTLPAVPGHRSAACGGQAGQQGSL